MRLSDYLEYESVVRYAMRMYRLVFAFDKTVHQRIVMQEGHIYGKEQVDRMISDISRAMFPQVAGGVPGRTEKRDRNDKGAERRGQKCCFGSASLNFFFLLLQDKDSDQ